MSVLRISRIEQLAVWSVVALLMLVAFVPAFVTRANDCTDAGYEWTPDAYGGTCGDSGGSGSAVVLTMTANPGSIQQGSSSTLSWGWDRDLSNPGSFTCSIDNGVGAVEVIGSRVVTPAATTNYTITCVYSYYSYGPVTVDFISSATVTVTPASVPPVTATLTATPTSVATGGSTTLTWSSTNAQSCNGTGFSTGGATSGSVVVSSITSTTNYSVTCMGAGGGSGSGTWQYRESDTSDFACPLTDPNRAYSSTPNCPVSPAGKACSPSSGTICKVNTINACNIDTTLYNCVGGSATPAPTATAYATVNVTSDIAGGCGEEVVAGLNCMAGEPVFAQCGPGQRAYYNQAETTRTCSTNGYSHSAQWGRCVDDPTCTAPSLPNLTVGSVSPTTAVAGTARSFSATVQNNSPVAAAPGWSETQYQLYGTAKCTNAAIISSSQIYTSGTYFDDGTSGGDMGYYEELDRAAGICAANGAACCTARERFRNPKGSGAADDDLYMSFQLYAGNPGGTTYAPDEPYSGTYGTATFYRAYNRESSSMATVIPNIIQVDNDADHNTVTQTVAASTLASVAANGTGSITGSYTFPASGTYPQTWYVRSCADSSVSFVGVVSESSEGDNCSPWATVTVTGPSGGVSSCTVSPSTITTGGSVTWSASPTNVGPYTWTPSEGGSAGGTGATLARTYATAGTYSMSVTAGGATRACPNVTVTPPVSCGTPNPTITASPDRVTSGGTSTLTVSASGVDTTCTVRNVNTNTVLRTITATTCNVPTTTISTGSLTTQTTFSVTCGSVTDEVVVNVIPNFDEF